MKKTLFFLVFAFFLGIALAIPPIEQEFYGAVLLSGTPAPPLTKIQAYFPSSGNQTICGEFQSVNAGKYGLLSCMGDDPDTLEIEGAIENQKITFKIETFNATNESGNMSFFPIILNTTTVGNDSWNSGEFHRVDLYTTYKMWWIYEQNQTNETNQTQEIGFCGDAICGLGEDCTNCQNDCGLCPPAPPGTGTGGGEKEAGAPKEKRASGGGTKSAAVAMPTCIEQWQCSDFSKCQPNGQKYRTCEDAAKCGTEKNRPKLNESCCYEEWICFEWGECSPLGEQTRTCNDKNQCNTTETIPNATQSCKYPTCNDETKNQNEEGIDCGGPCPPCKGIEYKKPVVERPTSVAKCGDGICNIDDPCNCPQDCRKFPWFIVVIGLAISIIEHLINRYRAKKIRNNIYFKKMQRLKKAAEIRRNSFWFKTTVMIISIILAIYIYFFATCPGSFRKYLFILIIAATTAPIIGYFILKRFEYSEEEKQIRYEGLLELHKSQLEKYIDIENREIAKIELEIIDKIKTLNIPGMDAQLKMQLSSIGYKIDMLSKFLNENEDYVDVEQKLCDELSSLREQENYKETGKNDEFKSLDSYLGLLLNHHKNKQELRKNVKHDQEKIREIEENIEFDSIREKISNVKGEIDKAEIKEKTEENQKKRGTGKKNEVIAEPVNKS